MQELVVASQNKGKVAEIQAVFAHLPFTVLSLAACGIIKEPAETGMTFMENAVLKAHYYAAKTGKACLADDSGLEVDILGGEPGVYSARFAGEDADDAKNNQKLLARLEGVPREKRSGRFRCALAFVDPDGTLITAEGACEGIILPEPRGKNGFGYDPLFFLPAFQASMAELTMEEKNAVSHRGQALKNMAVKLAGYRQ
ncbi:Hypothetical protein LUCI_1745 [Lucifera butyrica]|uniref:dITP/XTP pyrophosphatase n=1 Tax=Lucifera butyrica TaxID=1351585 RepID=A0A498R8A9_9FIRM|nr:XTP/dITP diphosphatase [Lucifera butyrica]VBB06512.1 Hypothetical protein LUCI_1745 [Lucifera butyrica]